MTDSFVGLTADICAQAWSITKAAFYNASSQDLLDKQAGTIVVLRPNGNKVSALGCGLVNAAVSEFGTGTLMERGSGLHVLFADHISDVANPRYTWYALQKALLAERTGMPTGTVRETAPWLLNAGDIKWRGGVTENGLTVGFSGVQENFDNAIALTMIDWIQAILRQQFKDFLASDESFVPPIS